MTAIVAALPLSWQNKAKAIAAAVGAIVAAIVVSVPNLPEWTPVVVSILTVLGVYQTPNLSGDANADA